MIYFTSGTVGYPKMVLHSHASYPIGHTITGKYWLDLRPSDLHWNLSETGWAKAAWSNLFGPWNMGASIFTYDGRGKFSARETLEFLQRYPITTFCAPPTVYRMLVLEDLSAYRFAQLRHCTGAGEPLNPEVIATWRSATGLTIHDGYGQTESVLLCGNFPCMPVKPGSMGKPSPGFDLAVIGDDGQPLGPDREGDIGVKIAPERPLGLFQEYWRNPEATAGAIRGDWYITGDRAMTDEDGYFWFVGRADDVILSAGYRIGPFEVESALVEHPAVAETAVVASPDELRGEVVKAFVVLVPSQAASDSLVTELQEHVKSSDRALQVPARDRVCGRAAQNHQRQDPPRRAARARAAAQAARIEDRRSRIEDQVALSGVEGLGGGLRPASQALHPPTDLYKDTYAQEIFRGFRDRRRVYLAGADDHRDRRGDVRRADRRL